MGKRSLVLGLALILIGGAGTLLGRPAAPFTLALFDGGPFALAEQRGKVVVVNFFASWCIPCREEAPALVRVWERYRKSDVVLVGIVYQDSPQAAKEFHDRLGQTWPIALDDNARTSLAFGVFGIPETFFVDPAGVIRGRHIGPIDEDTLIRGIEELRPSTR